MYQILSDNDPKGLADRLNELSSRAHTFVSDVQFSTVHVRDDVVRYSALVRYETRTYRPRERGDQFGPL